MATTVDTNVALVSLADLKEYVKVSGLTQDSILSAILNAVSQAINTYLGRVIISATKTEYYDGDGTDELMLARFPITSVTSLHDDPLRVFGDDTAIDVSADVMIEGDIGALRLWNNEGAFLRGRGNVKVVYVSGYTLANVPADLRLACLRWCATVNQRYTHKRHDIQTQTTRDLTTTFLNRDMPEDVRQLLDPHKAPATSSRYF